MSQIVPDSIRKDIRHNYAGIDLWLGGVQVVRNGVWLKPQGEALLEEKVKAHIRWMKKHPKRAKEEALV